VFWSRGNGWVFAGLVHVLQNMLTEIFPSCAAERLRVFIEINKPQLGWAYAAESGELTA
jgi:hypothetical protein